MPDTLEYAQYNIQDLAIEVKAVIQNKANPYKLSEEDIDSIEQILELLDTAYICIDLLDSYISKEIKQKEFHARLKDVWEDSLYNLNNNPMLPGVNI